MSVINFIFGAYIQYLGSNTVDVEGITIFLDGDSISIFTKGSILRRKHEQEECELIRSHVDDEDDIVELGAGTGYLTTLLHQSTAGRVTAVEADPRLIDNLNGTKERNNLNFEVVHKAYSSTDGEVEFPLKDNLKFGGLHADGQNSITVETTTLKRLPNTLSEGPFGLVVDIEGSEVDLIKNEIDVIEEDVEWMMIEFHPGVVGNDQIEQIKDILSDSSLHRVEADGNVAFYEK